ncbi:chitobiase-like [Gigantopelta aegis]|uniref:chitobiase-like n=1 Tax=Gigantopelta aegis TaxID=1735272 RepID=UPI001B88959C|nr:chitobiase-like [Gigantopelta aegis]XP_041348401.1 chitobiase-like [Gigantopelta aegis]XP_041348402.1 chitobiase-like [Gigantopelta aegis]XP_041348403.1 chitobiase-like [Gigantopelta aegis]
MNQDQLNTLGKGLEVLYRVNDNLSGGHSVYSASIIITNRCQIPLPLALWTIYFCHDRMIQPESLPRPEGYVFEDAKVKINHVNGCLFQLQPVNGFKGLKEHESLEVNFHAKAYSVARSDLYPNWYIVLDDLEPELIASTVGEGLTFVEPFKSPAQWKRFDYELSSGRYKYDLYDPFTPEVRFEKNKAKNIERAGKYVIPTPKECQVNESNFVDLKENTWAVAADKPFTTEAWYIADKIGAKIADQDVNGSPEPRTHLILLKFAKLPDKEQYCLRVDPKNDSITIEARGSAGMFYGIQSLLALVHGDRVPEVVIMDKPRFQYRGMHVDVSRNFHPKEEIFKLLDAMAMYKLNKFHFHLTDDEGWRLEIPGLPELTEIGSKRGHDMSEKTSLLPLLGSGPKPCLPGSGYYSVDDYKEILKYANERHIEVIPEIDVPGHSHAAIRSMEARYHRLMKKNERDATAYLLTDMQMKGESISSLMFIENSLNPGLESTYTFIEKVIVELKAMHKDHNELRMFHFGGDEVPFEAWEDSPACRALIDAGVVSSFDGLMEYFVLRVAELAKKHGLDIGAWQDAVVPHKKRPLIPRLKFPNENITVFAWKNVWETGMASDAYLLANDGYKVVMSQATHLYFDHPYEPDPEERGLYWATRYIDTHKTFSFTPSSLYANADYKITGEAIQEDDSFMTNKVQLEKSENIIGMQGQLWSELVRNSNQFDNMVFPRLVALAERAWHRASWEDTTDGRVNKEKQSADWELFANSLGHREFSRMDELGIAYHLPPPGARFCLKTRRLKANCAYPGLPIELSLDGGKTWKRYNSFEIVDQAVVLLRTCSADGKRQSRQIEFKMQT